MDIFPTKSMLTDQLTGAYSRASLDLQLQQEAARAVRYSHTFSLLVLDLDHFKSINDAFGHSRGDQVLVGFVERMRTIVRTSDMIFRYGGDEFVVILPDTDKAQATVLANRLLEATIATPFSGDPLILLSISAGIASFPEDTPTISGLFEKADQRSYLAKRNGRSQVVSQDKLASDLPNLQETSRLIERDQALETLQVFLRDLPTYRQGVLVVHGVADSGISRFLTQVRTIARLRGYGLLSIEGTSALKSRYLGALSEALQKLPNFPEPILSEGHLSAALTSWVQEQHYQGLFIVVDNWTDLDRATYQFLEHFLTNNRVIQLGLVCGMLSSSYKPALLRETVLYSVVELAPLSKNGLRIWLRTSLQVEPSETVVDWFHTQTEGLPVRIRRVLNWLAEQQLLLAGDESWNLESDLFKLPLKEYLSQNVTEPLTNLPVSLPLFVGREEYLRQIKQQLQTERLVTIVGPGGVGKTRLALQIGAELLETFRQGVYFVNLAGTEAARFVIPAITEALRLPLSGGQSPQAQFHNYLRDKEILLVLDNFEHLLRSSHLLVEMLAAAPGLKLLITSRERLNLPFEAVCTVKGLPYPASADAPDFESYEAVLLFIQSGCNVYGGFKLAESDRPWLVRLCRLVEGVPLGLVLAVAWIRSVSLSEIVQELERDMSFSLDEAMVLPERHQSLQVALDWFWKRLSSHEQKILQKLSIFRGGFTLEAAQKVAQASPFFLDGLIAKSFLHFDWQGRYEMHELLRQYATHKLETSPADLRLARQRHSQFYTTFLQRRAEGLANGQLEAVEEALGDLENLRAAWQWAVSAGQVREIAHGGRGLSRLYQHKGFNNEGEHAIASGIASLRSRLSKPDHPEKLIQVALASLLVEQCYFLKERSSFDQLGQAAQEAIDLSHTTGQLRLEAEALMRRGSGLMWQGQSETALACLERGLKLARSSRATLVEAATLRCLGLLNDMQADFPQSIEYARQALRLYRKLGHKLWESSTLSNLGEAHLQQGEYSLAQLTLEDALSLAREIRFGLIQTSAAESLGKAMIFMGEYARAKTYLEQALSLSRQTGNTRLEAECLSSLGLLYHLLGENLISLDYDEQALKITREQGNRQYEAYTLTYLGHALTDLERINEAQGAYQMALDIRRDLGQSGKAMEPLAGLTRIYLKESNLERALACAEEIYNYLQVGYLNGASEPLRIYLTCFEVLEAAGDPRSPGVLHKATELLLKRAQQITSEAGQTVFLEKIAVHHTILSLSSRCSLFLPQHVEY